jgi:hypothetical protein
MTKRKNGKWLPEYTPLSQSLCKNGDMKLADMKDYFPNFSLSSLRKKANFLKIHNGYLSNKLPYNKEALLSLNPAACYWMGFLCADGSFIKRSDKNIALSISLAKEDEEFVYQLRDFLKAKTQIKDRYVENDKYKTKKGGWHTYFSLSVSDIYWKLTEIYGDLHDKTYRGINLSLPSNDLKLAFLLGYICGDGCVSFSKEKQCLTIGVTSSAENTLYWIKDFVKSLELPAAPGFGKKILFPDVRKTKGKAGKISFNGIRAAYLYKLLKLVPVSIMKRKFENPEIEEFVEGLFKRSSFCNQTIDEICFRNKIDFSKTFPLPENNSIIPPISV